MTGLTGNVEYKFRVRAHNAFGWGLESPEIGFYTSDKPGAPTTVVTALNNMNIKISWVAPSSNYKVIDAYKI